MLHTLFAYTVRFLRSVRAGLVPLAIAVLSCSDRSPAVTAPIEASPSRVLQTTRRATTQLVTLRTETSTLVTTPDHPFAKVDSGWTPAARLRVGDTIHVRGSGRGTKVLELSVREVPPTPVYNLTVDRTHTYFVGSQDLLVHNVSCFNWGRRSRARPPASPPPREHSSSEDGDGDHDGSQAHEPHASTPGSSPGSTPGSTPGSSPGVSRSSSARFHAWVSDDWKPPKNVALGLNPSGTSQLTKFAREHEAKNYWDVFPNNSSGLSNEQVAERIKLLMHTTDHLHFNLDGLMKGNGRTMDSMLSLDGAIYAGEKGVSAGGNFTNWELYYVVSHPKLFAKTTFYFNGAPFKFPPGLMH